MYQQAAFGHDIPWDDRKTLVTTGEQFEAMLRQVRAANVRVFDHETSGLAWFQHARSCGLALGVFDAQGVRAWYVPYRHQTHEPQLDIERISPAFRELFAEPHVLWIAHNLKFDEHINRCEGWTINGGRYCTQTAARLYNENQLTALKKRAHLDLGHHWAGDWEKLLDAEVNRLAKSRRMKKTEYKALYGYAETPIDLCGFYACYDVDFAGQLYAFYEGRHSLSTTYPRIWQNEMELLEALCDMEEYGMPIDVGYLDQLGNQLTEVCQRLGKELSHMLQWAMFNIGSDKELRSFLYDRLRFPVTLQTKSGLPSVEADVLEDNLEVHPAIPLILEWRTAQKIRTTWTQSILNKLDANHILHGQLKNEGTNTGRLSSSEPNLQNFATDDDDRAQAFSGRRLEDGGVDPWSVRRAFVMRTCADGRVMPRLYFDYSQIELRVMAYYTRDPIMVETYQTGGDIHSRTAREVGSLLTGEPIPRRPAKVINFGLSYCMSALGLARNAKISQEEAEKFLDAFFQRYRGIESYRETFWTKCRFQNNSFVNMFGRPRRIPNLTDQRGWARRRAERQAFGTLIQGTAAQLTKESITRVHQWLKSRPDIDARLVSTVHDEIWLDVDPSCLTVVVPKVKQLMESFPEFGDIPIVVDGQYSTTNWAEKVSLPA